MEGEFRACHSGILSHSEEIAFFRGNKWEKDRVNGIFKDLCSHKTNIFEKRFYMGLFDNFLYKYGSLIVGYSLLAVPVFGPGGMSSQATQVDISNVTRDYIRNSTNLINLSKVWINLCRLSEDSLSPIRKFKI